MNLERLATALDPADVVRLAPVEVLGLAYDARAVEPGFLFFCVPGTRADGHDFAGDAVARGAAALVVERPLELDVPQLVVADSRAAMAVAADVFFGRPTHELPVVGITGTNGKTTTSYLVHAILEAAGLHPGLLGTIETRIGDASRPAVRTTPEAIDLQHTFRAMLDAGNRSAAIEASSHASELRRLDRVRFAALVFTNLTQDHLDFHETMERYFGRSAVSSWAGRTSRRRRSTSTTRTGAASPRSCSPSGTSGSSASGSAPARSCAPTSWT
jgi:UDP-N-acetylmuramoyl-L-alanyl-D-glutamate--2,6-diaminopimelate ligase